MSKMTDYGFVLLAALSRWQEGEATARTLAEKTRVPLPSASKVLKVLHRKGVLHSRRGMGGGYRLSRPAQEISVAGVLAALEGPLSLTDCGAPGGEPCGLLPVCTTKVHWRAINQTILQALEGLSLADLGAKQKGRNFAEPKGAVGA